MIRAVYEQRGEFAVAIVLRQRFPGITDNTQAQECACTIAGWKLLPPPRPAKRMPKVPRLRRMLCRGAVAAIEPRSISLPALKDGFVFSPTATASPVRGLCPMRALRCFTVKAPNPRNSTRSPRARAAVIWSNIVATTSSASACRRCGLLAVSSAMSLWPWSTPAPWLTDKALHAASSVLTGRCRLGKFRQPGSSRPRLLLMPRVGLRDPLVMHQHWKWLSPFVSYRGIDLRCPILDLTAPFYLIVADRDRGVFAVEGPMTDDRPWEAAAKLRSATTNIASRAGLLAWIGTRWLLGIARRS